MKQKTLTIILGMIFLIGLVAAANTLSNLEGITIPVSPVIAGNTFSANFSFNYLADGTNEDDSPLIIKLNLSSDDQTNYPVWKGDFEIEGFVDKCIWNILGVCVYSKTVYFSCSENETQIIINPIDTTTINNISNGTFYCYNADGDLELNEHDEVFLNITSHPALYPSQYTLMAEMFYLNDTTAPLVVILNKNDFDGYYKAGSYVNVKVNITEGRGLSSYSGTIFTPSVNYTYSLAKNSDGFYYFMENLPSGISEGDYLFNITAVDTSGNIGSDNVTLKTDETGPELTLVEPQGGVYSEIIPIKFNVTDARSRVNNQSVKCRLREIKEGIGICPATGGSINGTLCTTTPWINMNLNTTSNLYELQLNTTEYSLTSGSYWLDAKAEDILGNKNDWIA
ncbi:MAG: hypothetical protein ABIJ14_03675 [Nanoarchaeota archaeon]